MKVFLFFLCLFCPLLLRAVEVVDGPKVETADTTAVVRWKTDVECGSGVTFGVNEGALNRKAEGAVGLLHEVKLEGLQPGTAYFFTVGTARKPLTKGTFTTTGKAGKPAAPPAEPAKKSESKPADSAKPAPPKADATPVRSAPPAKQTWGDIDSLQDHYVRHGRDFKSTSPEDYAAKAWLFLQRAIDEGLPAKLDEDGTIRVWDGKSRAFAAYNRNFTTKTYFKPNSQDYFERQPGKSIRLRRPEPKTPTAPVR